MLFCSSPSCVIRAYPRKYIKNAYKYGIAISPHFPNTQTYTHPVGLVFPMLGLILVFFWAYTSRKSMFLFHSPMQDLGYTTLTGSGDLLPQAKLLCSAFPVLKWSLKIVHMNSTQFSSFSILISFYIFMHLSLYFTSHISSPLSCIHGGSNTRLSRSTDSTQLLTG